MQSRKHSVYEVLTNTFTGMVGSWIYDTTGFRDRTQARYSRLNAP